MRIIPLVSEQYYHILNRSIAGYKIFENPEDYRRIIELLDLYRFTDFGYKYSNYLALSPYIKETIKDKLKQTSPVRVNILAYCIMPTHFHLVLKQIEDKGISLYMAKVLDSYSKFFNIKHQRKGPLWEGRFKNILLNNDEQLLHLTRYIHLNPTSANLTKEPEKWAFSSYKEYLSPNNDEKICNFEDILTIDPKKYKAFVTDRKDYQKKLSNIKKLLIDNYSG